MSAFAEPKKPFFTSITLHAFLLALALLFYLKNRETPLVPAGTLEVNLVDDHPRTLPRPLSRPSLPRMSRAHRSDPGASHPISLNDLGVSIERELQSMPQSNDSNDSYEHPVTDPHSPTFADGDWDLLNPNPVLARFNQYLYYTVQGWLDRYSALNPMPIFGSVRVKLCFSGTGEYLEDETVIEADDPNFRNLVVRSLRKALEHPIPKVYLPEHRKFYVERSVVIRMN